MVGFWYQSEYTKVGWVAITFAGKVDVWRVISRDLPVVPVTNCTLSTSLCIACQSNEVSFCSSLHTYLQILDKASVFFFFSIKIPICMFPTPLSSPRLPTQTATTHCLFVWGVEQLVKLLTSFHPIILFSFLGLPYLIKYRCRYFKEQPER